MVSGRLIHKRGSLGRFHEGDRIWAGPCKLGRAMIYTLLPCRSWNTWSFPLSGSSELLKGKNVDFHLPLPAPKHTTWQPASAPKILSPVNNADRREKSHTHHICYCCSVAKSCLTLHEPMDCSTPGFPVLHCLPRVCLNSYLLSWWCHLTILSSVSLFASCLQSFPTSGSFTMSQLFASGRAKVLEFQLQYQSFQWIFRTDFP